MNLYILVPVAESSVTEIQTQPESPVFKQKKNFKIWFSPRSRKVRCMVEKPLDITVANSESSGEKVALPLDAITTQQQDLSVFNFTSSSQDSGSSSPQRCNDETRNRKNRSAKKNAASRKKLVQGATTTTRKQTKQNMKKKRLEAINQQWGIIEDVDMSMQKDQACAEGAKRSSKRVSFLSPAVTSDKPQPEVSQGNNNELSTVRSTMRESLSGGGTTETNHSVSPSLSMLVSVIQEQTPSVNALKPTDDPEKRVSFSPIKPSTKTSRVEMKVSTLETTPKRPRTSPVRRRKSLGQMSPAVLSPASVTSPVCDKNTKSSRKQQVNSPSVLATCRKSPCTRGASVGRPSSASPAVKRNHKGETLLHLAAIKVERF